MNPQELLAAIRAHGLTQLEIADEIGASQSAVHAWLHGNRGTANGISGKYLLKLIALHDRLKRAKRKAGETAAPQSEEPRIPMPIVCAGDQLKRAAAVRAGYRVDVWIDDCPGVIEPQRIVDFDSP